MCHIRFVFCLLGLWVVGMASAQELPARRSASVTAIVSTNDPAAHVFADSTWLGPASVGRYSVPEGTRFVRVVPTEFGAWGLSAVRSRVGRQDTLRIEARFPYGYRLEATPYAARVSLESDGEVVLLGETPLNLSLDEPASGTLVFEREGFEPVRMPAGSELWNRRTAVMVPLGRPARPLDVSLDLPRRNHRWIDYTALGLAAVGGALAVHYKTKADNRYDLYRENGDPTLRPRIDQLDARSAVALGGMQVGVGILALRLVFR